MQIDLLTAFTPSTIRRYIPRDTAECPVLRHLHANLRGLFRALASYRHPDTYRGSKYQPLSRLVYWVGQNTRVIQAVTEADFHHLDGLPCEECRVALSTGFHTRALDVAAQIIEEEQARVAAALEVIAL